MAKKKTDGPRFREVGKLLVRTKRNGVYSLATFLLLQAEDHQYYIALPGRGKTKTDLCALRKAGYQLESTDQETKVSWSQCLG